MPARSFRSLLFLPLAAALLVFAAGCDSNSLDDEVAPPTLAFGTASLSALEADTPVIELPVVLNNPDGSQVTAEVLYAGGANEEDEPLSTADLADFGIEEIDDERASYNDDGELVAYVVGEVTFPADAEDGATRTLRLPIDDDVEEDQETALFALQSASAESGAEVALGDQRALTLTIEGEGTVTLLSADFFNEDEEAATLDPFTQFSVASTATWETSSSGDPPNAPYALANGFGADEPSNDWLISPALDFNSVEDEIFFFLNAKGFDDGGLERGLQVKVSTDYDGEGNPENFTWTDISDRVENFSPGEFEFVSSGQIDLSDAAFQSDATYIAFQYRSSGTGGGSTESWEVDDVVVQGRAASE